MSDEPVTDSTPSFEPEDRPGAGGTPPREQPWKLAGKTPGGGEVWIKPVGKEDSSSHLAAWAPEKSDADETIEAFLSAPDRVREHIDEIEGQRAPQMAMSGPHLPHLAAGRSTVPQPLVSQHREKCDHCGGSGYMPGINDYLCESIALIGDQGDELIRAFYRRLFTAAPEVAKLFPANPAEGDLGTDHRGAQQREKLLAALVALSGLYDPDDVEKMDRLDRALAAYGRSHAAFARADGTVKGATWEEYGAVKDALFATLVSAAGNAWKPEYAESWSQAYDYAAAVMVAEQYRSGFSLPRFPRA